MRTEEHRGLAGVPSPNLCVLKAQKCCCCAFLSHFRPSELSSGLPSARHRLLSPHSSFWGLCPPHHLSIPLVRGLVLHQVWGRRCKSRWAHQEWLKDDELKLNVLLLAGVGGRALGEGGVVVLPLQFSLRQVSGRVLWWLRFPERQDGVDSGSSRRQNPDAYFPLSKGRVSPELLGVSRPYFSKLLRKSRSFWESPRLASRGRADVFWHLPASSWVSHIQNTRRRTEQ